MNEKFSFEDKMKFLVNFFNNGDLEHKKFKKRKNMIASVNKAQLYLLCLDNANELAFEKKAMEEF